jgi:hypothetical protein
MKLNTLLTINAILATLHGLGFILAPSLLLSIYQIPSSPGALLTGQLFGGQLLGLGVLTWTARQADESRPNMPVIWAGLVSNPVGAVLCLWGIQQGSMGVTGWLGVAIYAGLALGYFAVRGPAQRAAAGVAA